MRKIFFIALLSTLVVTLGFAYTKHQENRQEKTFSKLSTDNLLAISWQNAFCETHRNKRECRNVKPSAYQASHFTLHGLWPQPRHKVNCQGSKKVWLEKPLYQELLRMMPAVKSGLHTHEWKKHGTCYGKDDDGYFEDSIALIKQVNGSVVRDLFANNIGNTLTHKSVMQAFDRAYGKGAGRKVKMMCKKGLITELQINLSGEITPRTPIAKLLKGARNAKGGCKKGHVDAVGFRR